MVNSGGVQSQADTEDARREAQWARQARSGDRAAYGLLVVAYQDRIYNAMLRMVGDREEARELTQEAFTRGLAKLDNFRGDSSPFTWLFRIAMNLALTQLRRESRRRVFSLDQPCGKDGAGHGQDQASGLMERSAQAHDSPPEELERREEQEMVLAALGRVDADYRAVLVLRDIEGVDYQQMGQLLELPLGTIKSRLFRARLALRDELKKYVK